MANIKEKADLQMHLVAVGEFDIDGVPYVGPKNHAFSVSYHSIDIVCADLLRLAEACEYALSYLPAKDGKRTGEPDGDVQLMICNKLKVALGITPASAERKGR